MPTIVRCVICQKIVGVMLQGACTVCCMSCTIEHTNFKSDVKGDMNSYGEGMIPKFRPKSV